MSATMLPLLPKKRLPMQVNHEFDIHIHRIKSYGPGEVAITLPFDADTLLNAESSEEGTKGVLIEKLTQSAIILPELLIKNWAPQKITELRREDVQRLANLRPELVIIGTGKRLLWPERALLTPLMEAGIGYEIMDTAAACRTYNILSYEGRVVAAALMMIEH